MARRNGNLGSWVYGGAPAQGSTPHPQGSDGSVATGFLAGIDNATDDPIKQYQVPSLSGSTVRGDVSPGVWGRACKCP